MRFWSRLYPSAFIAGIFLAFGSTLLTGLSARGQVVTFADGNLDAAVRSALQITPPTPIYRTNMLTLTNLSAAYRSIASLGGLEAAVNLRQLELTGNPLLNVPELAALTNLTQLQMAFCQVTNGAPLAGLTNLLFLDAGWNRDAGDNSIRDVSFLANLKRLQWLSLFYLRIHDVAPLATLTALTNLNFDYNYNVINSSALNGMTNMVELYVSNDGLYDIAFVSHMPVLRILDMGGNNIADLSPAVGRNLMSLWAYFCPLSNASLVTNFAGLKLLHYDGLSLSNASYLSRLPSLTELSLDSNPAISDFSFLSSLTNLISLSLGSSSITTLPNLSSLRGLTELHLHDDGGLTSIATLAGLTNLTHLDLNNSPGINFGSLIGITNLTWLEINNDGLKSAPFVPQMPRLQRLDINYDQFTVLDSLSNSPLNELYAANNRLTDIGALLSMALYYADVRNNLLDLSPTAPAGVVISNLQMQAYVDYNPQHFSGTLTVWDQPAEQCLSVGGTAYFAVGASTTANALSYQWQRNSVDLAGETNSSLYLFNVHSNDAGLYRAMLFDDNGGQVTAPARLYVGDPLCGRTIHIQFQPANACAGPGEDVTFSISATSTHTNLYYQWQFNGTNVDGATNSELDLFAVDQSNNGFYQVLLWDDTSNAVASAQVELKVVDVIDFSDPNLKNLVSQQLSLPSSSPIHLSDLDNLGYLSIGYHGITNIGGLECARYLYSLDLSGNHIADPAPLAWLNNLQYLYLNDCALQDASFVFGLTNLSELALSYNSLHSVPLFESGVNLGYLDLNRNGCLINTPRLTMLTNIYWLGLHGDCIPDISFVAGMPRLQLLDVGADWLDDPMRNSVSDISSLAGKTALDWLSLSFDQVTNIPVLAPLTNMAWLYLSSNHFSNISFVSNMPGLLELSVNLSGVTNLSALASHTNLTMLDIGNISTTNLSVVTGLTNLQTLWAGGNHAGSANFVAPLKNLTLLSLELNNVADLSPLANITNLYWLSLENNLITNIGVLAGRPPLQNLYLSGNRIKDLSPLSGDTNLLWLSLNGNGFTNISPLGNLHNLVWLMMQSNHVQNVAALAGFTNNVSIYNVGNLYYGLDLSGNELTDISPLTNIHAMTWIGLWQNKLASLPSLAGWPYITSMDLWGNQLTNIAGVSGMAQLNWLGLSRNNLSVIQPLSGLPNLTSLDLYTNHITDVSGLANLTSLRWLYLYDNDLQNIHPLTSLTSLYYADLTYNRLDTNIMSAAMLDISQMQANGAYVNYIPQKSSTSGTPITLLSPFSLGGNQFRFTVQSAPGVIARISSSSNLATWSPLGFVTNLSGNTNFTDTAATGRAKFYRAQQF